MWVQSLGQEEPLEEGMTTHSSILAWRIPMDREDWRVTVHRVTKSRTQLNNQKTTTTNMYFLLMQVFWCAFFLWTLHIPSIMCELLGISYKTLRWLSNLSGYESESRFNFCVSVCSCAHSYVLTLCDPMDCSSPGSFVHGILQARILEWVAIAFSRGSSQPRGRTRVSCVSCIGRPILYHCTTWEALKFCNSLLWRSF